MSNSELFQFIIMMTAFISLVYKVVKDHLKINKLIFQKRTPVLLGTRGIMPNTPIAIEFKSILIIM